MKHLFKKCFCIALICLFFPKNGNAQITFRVLGGVSSIEHLSTGLNITTKRKHAINFLFGSYFFLNSSDNASYLLQYKRYVYSLKFIDILPAIGIKGGYSLYSDKYYRWELLSICPSFGLNYALTEKLNLELDAGVVYSRVLSLKRINFGEIGWYNELIPEIKISFLYTLFE